MSRPDFEDIIFEKVEVEIKYDGYIDKQKKLIDEMKRLEKMQLPISIDYSKINGLRIEAQEKLNKIKPENLGQASRILGVSPADISVLIVWLHKSSKNI